MRQVFFFKVKVKFFGKTGTTQPTKDSKKYKGIRSKY
jgi:hypothetical protein